MMKVYRKILGNIADKQWAEQLKGCEIDYIELDQWNAQKSRLLAVGSSGQPYAMAFERGVRLHDGDIIDFNNPQGSAAIVRLRLSDVLVVDLSSLNKISSPEAISTAIELGHAIGNQHWPAVVSEQRLYVPQTVDKKVMLSVLRTYNFDSISFVFRSGREVVPYLSPTEVRTLFGSAGGGDHHNGHDHTHNTDHHDHHSTEMGHSNPYFISIDDYV